MADAVPFKYTPKPYVYKKKPIPGGRADELYRFKLSDLGDFERDARAMEKAMRDFAGSRGLLYEVNQWAVNKIKVEAAKNLERKIKQHGRPRFNNTTDRVTLRKVILNDASHTVTPDGFRFMVEDKVRAQIDYAFSLEYGDDSQIGRDIYFLFLGRNPNVRRDELKLGRIRGRTNAETQAQANADPSRGFNKVGDKKRSRTFSHRPSFARSQARQTFGAQFTSDRILGPRELGHTKDPKLTSREFLQKRFQVRIQNPVPEYRYGRDAGDAFKRNRVKLYGDEITRRWDSRYAQATGVDLVAEVNRAKAERKAAAKAANKNKPRVQKLNLKGSGDGKFGPVTVIPGNG